MDLVGQLLKLGQQAGEGPLGGGIGQLFCSCQPRRRGNRHRWRVDLGGQLGPLLAGFVLLGQQLAYQEGQRAITACGQSGFGLPPDLFDLWREVEITFNPARMSLR
jgi:hypothetical protein